MTLTLREHRRFVKIGLLWPSSKKEAPWTAANSNTFFVPFAAIRFLARSLVQESSLHVTIATRGFRLTTR